MVTETELRQAALTHGSIPPDLGIREKTSPLYGIIPNSKVPSEEIRSLVEKITGKKIKPNTKDPRLDAAKLRAYLNRWAVKQVGIMARREDVEAREMHRSPAPVLTEVPVTPPKED